MVLQQERGGEEKGRWVTEEVSGRCEQKQKKKSRNKTGKCYVLITKLGKKISKSTVKSIFWDIDTIFTILALYTTTMDLK